MCHVGYVHRLLRLLIFTLNAALSISFGGNRINRYVDSLILKWGDDVSIYHKSRRPSGVELKSNTLSDHGDGEICYNSHIASIRAYNLAGVVNKGDDKVISIEFGAPIWWRSLAKLEVVKVF